MGQSPDINTYFLSDSLYELAKDSSYWSAAQELSFIGEYKSALAFYDKDVWLAPKLTSKDSSFFTRFKPVNALSYFSKIAEKEKIIIINEAHHQPYHRVFTTILLKELYAKGFRYFGAETLNQWDTLMNYRKYPIQNSGYYTKDPLYSEMIRTALEIGFTVFAYESNVRDTSEQTPTSISIREIEQAKNIKKILNNDSNAKVLIHCGYDHLVETYYPGWGKAMAGRLIEYTGINPFTIDQIEFTERSSLKYENALFDKINLDYYAIFVDSLGKLYNGCEGSKRYDANLYHPRTIWLYGRPNWVFENNRKPYFVNNKISIGFPCLVLAYLSDEKFSKTNVYDNPRPLDVIELKSKNESKALSLKEGNYKLIIYDFEGKRQVIEMKF
ncbi:MAG: hypothetical protein WCP69_12775 [Bacteroidota bacterium]